MIGVLLAAALVVPGASAGAAAQDSVPAARELYVSAGYEESLSMLDRLRAAEAAKPGEPRPEMRTIEQYRAFCLFALGRTADAEQAIERAVTLDPTWELEDGEAPPRLATFVSGVRTRALGDVLRARLEAAKKLQTEKKYEAASEAFTSILALIDHPSIARVASRDLTDLKTVASGFRDLAVSAHDQEIKAQERDKAAAEKEKELAKLAAAAAAAPTTTGRPATPTSSNEPVVPPIALNQHLPKPTDLTLPVGQRAIIIVDVLIDEFGRVERTSVRQSVNRVYEQQLLAAMRSWRYTPATQAGKTVKYVKTFEIELTPR
jgi:TonB family protein